jgi:hypothetical protein
MEEGVHQLQEVLNASFQNVKQDTHVLFNYLANVYQNAQHQDQKIGWLHQEIQKSETTTSAIHHQQKEQQQDLRTIHERIFNQQELISNLQATDATQKLLIEQLKSELEDIPKTPQEIREIIDDMYAIEDMEHTLDLTRHSIEDMRRNHSDLLRSHLELAEKQKAIPAQIATWQLKSDLQKEQIKEEIIDEKPKVEPKVRAEVESLTNRLDHLERKRTTIRERIVKKIVKNTKLYVKNLLIGYIKRYGKVSALQLKEMIVHDQQLCSKSSLYRMLDEIEREPDIGVIKTGKEKHYFSNLAAVPSKQAQKDQT